MKTFILGALAPLLVSLFIANQVIPKTNITNTDRNFQVVQSLYTIHFLLPFSEWHDLRPCSEDMELVKEFETSLECSNREIFSKAPYNQEIHPAIPSCWIVKVTSPDVHQTKVFNYLNISMFTRDGIVGFYEDYNKTIYIVENTDAPHVWRHELQHYFLDLVTGDGNGNHDHDIWKKCLPRYYSPSDEAYRKAGVEPPKENLEAIKNFISTLIGSI